MLLLSKMLCNADSELCSSIQLSILANYLCLFALYSTCMCVYGLGLGPVTFVLPFSFCMYGSVQMYIVGIVLA